MHSAVSSLLDCPTPAHWLRRVIARLRVRAGIEQSLRIADPRWIFFSDSFSAGTDRGDSSIERLQWDAMRPVSRIERKSSVSNNPRGRLPRSPTHPLGGHRTKRSIDISGCQLDCTVCGWTTARTCRNLAGLKMLVPAGRRQARTVAVRSDRTHPGR